MRAFVACIVLVTACEYSPPGLGGDDQQIDALTSDGSTPMIDAPVAPIDGPDASPSVCSTAGLNCAGGNAHLLATCTTAAAECLVGCRDAPVIVSPDEAEAACVAWGGHLATLASIAQENCVRQTINGAIILGMRQQANQTAPLLGWFDYTGQPITFFRWDTGQPNDAGGGEDGQEQCVFSNTDPAWHDTPCDIDASARWICRR